MLSPQLSSLNQAAAHAHQAMEFALAHGRAYDHELARRVLARLVDAERQVVL